MEEAAPALVGPAGLEADAAPVPRASLPRRILWAAMLLLGAVLSAAALAGFAGGLRSAALLGSGAERRRRRLSAEAPCDEIQRSIDFTTREQLASVAGVASAEDCRALCSRLPRCRLWTWGEVQDTPGVTHVCFPKALAKGEWAKEAVKNGVVSGSVCRRSPDEQPSGGQPSGGQPSDGQPSGGQPADPRPTCEMLQGVDFSTRASLPPVRGVTSAEICRATCRSAPGCGAWTWGRARGIPGVTDVCFLKKLAQGKQPKQTPKEGVVSGFACVPDTAAGVTATTTIPPTTATSSTTTAPATTTTSTTTVPPTTTEAPSTTTSTSRRRPSELYCFTLALPFGQEPVLLGRQREERTGIFACDAFAVYSNASFGEEAGIRVNIVAASLQCKDGGLEGPLNRAVFGEVWKKVLSDGLFWLYDWTAKVDPDAVFLPQRLRPLLRGYGGEVEKHQHGLYLNNCRFGLRGALEVFSSAAVQALGDGWQRCESHFRRLCSGDCRWGEDAFVDQCLSEALEVRREYAESLLVDERCQPPDDWQSCREPAVAFHPFASTGRFLGCLRGTRQGEGELVFK